MTNVIFYFTGTGNSFWAAKTLAEKMGGCEVIAINKYDITRSVDAKCIGFCYPVYDWGLPNIVKRFFENIIIEGDPYLFSVHTYGGYDGITAPQTKLYFLKRGRMLRAAMRIKLPQNYIVSKSLSVPSDKIILKQFAKAEAKINRFVSYVLQAKNYFERELFIYKPFHKLGYQINLQAEKDMPCEDKHFSVNENCIVCKKCERECPVYNIKIKEGKIHFKNHCEFCLKCLHVCPAEAINYKNITQGRKRFN